MKTAAKHLIFFMATTIAFVSIAIGETALALITRLAVLFLIVFVWTLSIPERPDFEP